MNILYFHANLLRDTYRCRQVRQRLLGFASESAFDILFIGGVDKNNLAELAALKQQLSAIDCPLIDMSGRYLIRDLTIIMDDLSLQIGEHRFVPLDGSVLVIQTEPEIKGSYVALDFFADESFSAYHSDMDAKTFLELRELLQGFPIPDKNHLN
ncbi:MAG: hypothetical protein WBL80_03105 [Erysipelotrichaceae bacterium]